MTKDQLHRLAKTIWDYHHLNHTIEASDLILALGSHDTRVAERGAELFLQGLAPWIAFSGGRGRLTEGWEEPEATVFARIARQKGVPDERTLIEDQSTNTGENVVNVRARLQQRGIKVNKIIVVQKPYMERRAYATVKQQWPEVEVIVTSPQVAFEDYPNDDISSDEVISIMVGDLQRIPIYAKRGFQIHQEVPLEVWEAYHRLVEAGYTSHLIPDED